MRVIPQFSITLKQRFSRLTHIVNLENFQTLFLPVIAGKAKTNRMPLHTE